MELTNRVLIIAGALVWMFAVLLVLILAWGAPDESIARIADLAGYLEDHNDSAAKLIITFGGLIFALLAVVVIIIEVAPPEAGSLKVQRVGTGEARIGTDEIALRLEEELSALPQLSQIQATVTARGQKAEVRLTLHVASDADLAATTDAACERARYVLEEQMGIALSGPPQAELHYRELRVSRPEGPPARAQEPPAQAAPLPSTLPAEPAPGPTEPPTFQPSRAAGEPAQPAHTEATAAPEATHEAQQTSQEDRPAGA